MDLTSFFSAFLTLQGAVSLIALIILLVAGERLYSASRHYVHEFIELREVCIDHTLQLARGPLPSPGQQSLMNVRSEDGSEIREVLVRADPHGNLFTV